MTADAPKLTTRARAYSASPAANKADSPNGLASPNYCAISADTEFAPLRRISGWIRKTGLMSM